MFSRRWCFSSKPWQKKGVHTRATCSRGVHAHASVFPYCKPFRLVVPVCGEFKEVLLAFLKALPHVAKSACWPMRTALVGIVLNDCTKCTLILQPSERLRFVCEVRRNGAEQGVAWCVCLALRCKLEAKITARRLCIISFLDKLRM